MNPKNNNPFHSLMKVLFVNEIVRAGNFLGETFTQEQREQLISLAVPQLIIEAQAAEESVKLRIQLETAEYTRKLIAREEIKEKPENRFFN